MALMSYRQYAAHRQCSVRAVQKAVGDTGADGKRDGRIAASLVPVEGSPFPKIDSVKADALWLLNTDETKRSTLFAPGPDVAPSISVPQQRTLDATEPEAEAFVPGEDAETVAVKKSYHQSKAKIAAVELEERELDLNLRKGKLISLAEAERLGFTTLRTLRDALRNTGPRIAAQVAAMTDPYDCEQVISAEIDAVLSSIKPEQLLAEQADDDDEQGG